TRCDYRWWERSGRPGIHCGIPAPGGCRHGAWPGGAGPARPRATVTRATSARTRWPASRPRCRRLCRRSGSGTWAGRAARRRGPPISIFVGAVLLPSLALSYVSIEFVPQLAMGKKASRYKEAERTLYYVEKDLGERAQEQALDAARAVGSERLLDGRPEVIVPA